MIQISQKGEYAMYFVTKHEVHLFVGKAIICTVEPCKLNEIILVFLGVFYLLDVDYPATHEIGLTLLHYLLMINPHLQTLVLSLM